MLRSKRSLSKTEWTDTFAYCSDASELFSFASGSIMFQLTLPNNISSGVYSLCDSEKYFSDYLLFAVNQAAQYVDYPGMYAAFSPDGIVFTVWTRYGRFSVIDDQTDIDGGDSFIIDFCWDCSGTKLGSGATMAIFVNGECTAAGNFLVGNETISGLNFYAFDSKNVDFNLICSIEDFACFSELPPSRVGVVNEITNYRFSDDEIVVVGRAGANIYVDGLNTRPVEDATIRCFGLSQHSVGACDITGNIYFCSFFDDSYTSGSVSKFDVSRSKIVKSIGSIRSPRSLSVIQKDGIDHPPGLHYDSSTCTGVWIAAYDRVIRTDSNLEIQCVTTGFTGPTCIKCGTDNTAWVSDTGANLVKHVSYDGQTILNSVPVASPSHLVVNNDDEIFVYSSSNTLSRIRNGAVVRSVSLSPGVVDMDISLGTCKIIVAYSDGTLEKYDRYLDLESSSSPTSGIDAICVRRGYNQNDIIIVNVDANLIVTTRLRDMGTIYQSVDFDDNVYFSGGICSTARSVGIETDMEGTFFVDFTVGMGAVMDVRSNAFKVDKHEIDLTNGGANGAYRALRGISPSETPTDDPTGVVRSAKIR